MLLDFSPEHATRYRRCCTRPSGGEKYAIVWKERQEWRTVLCDFLGLVWWERDLLSQVLVLVAVAEGVCAILSVLNSRESKVLVVIS